MKKIKVILFATNPVAIPAFLHLLSSGHELSVISTDIVYPENLQLEAFVKHHEISFIRIAKSEMKERLVSILNSIKPDICIVFTFSYKIPKVLLNIPTFGFYNIHFSLLPQNRGAAPIFWQLKNGDLNGGWSIIKMDDEMDTGPVVFQERLELMPGEISGSYSARLSNAAVPSVDQLIKLCVKGGTLELKPQDDTIKSYYRKPVHADLMINWANQTANEITHLVNACNPEYGGATTKLNGVEVKILEVSEAVFQLNEPRVPGEIIYSDPSYGIFVYCHGHSFLRLNMLKLPEGYVSGFKLIDLGLQPGMHFES